MKLKAIIEFLTQILFYLVNYLNEDYDNNKINRTLKNLYETDFFEKINISVENNIFN